MTDGQTNLSVLILVKVVTASVRVNEEMLISGVTYTLYLKSTVVSYFIFVILIMNMLICCRAVHICMQLFTSHIAASQDHNVPPIDCDGIY